MQYGFRVSGFISVFSFLAACGGGGGSGTVAESSVTISGMVTYTSYQLNPIAGLDYGVFTEKPIRGAVVELQNTSGTVLDSGNTDIKGSYSLTAPANASVRVVVKAALGSQALPHTKVVDNTSSGVLYAMSMDMTTGISNLAQNFNANSGWDGASYSGTRAAAPFAILDVIYQAEQLILAVDSGVVFPPLLVNWSINNKPAEPENLAAGDIGTSHFNANGQLYILGAANNDTDEYDTHVVAHEWAHYFEVNFSRSDSIGGGHGSGDILDPTLAFGEGFGNAFSGMVMDDPLYIDTGGISQATVNLEMDLDADSVPDTMTDTISGSGTTDTLLDGFYSESSIQEILYDLYDSGASDDDPIELGFYPIYDVLVNGQKTTPAFTSIFSFLYYLKQGNPASSAAITSLALSENIKDGNEYEATIAPIYTTVPFDGSIVTLDVDGYALQTWITYGPITVDNPGNKLFNLLYFKYTATTSGCYTLEVAPIAGGDLIIYGSNGMSIDLQGVGVAETATGIFSLNEKDVFAVGSLGGEEGFAVRLYLTPLAC